MKKYHIVLLLLLIFLTLYSQTPGNVDLNAYVTIQRGTDFNTALKVIETLSYQYESKRIVNTSSFNGPINIPVSQLQWKEALLLLCQSHNLNIEEKGGSYFIVDPPKEEPKKVDLSPSEKQVRITAIFFRADKSFLNSIGVDWSTLVNGKVVANVDFKGANSMADDIFKVKGSYSISQNGYIIDLSALLKIVESNQKGSVIAKPNISVLSGKEGYIQVGQDFSTKTIDKDGNIADKFFSTGIILKVIPTVVKFNDSSVVHLIASVEKSSATPGQLSTIINKNQANTEVYLYNGEETVIGGLYDTEITVSRSGIPLLKDLPWWVFGIRYLAGFNKNEQSTREMIIILKTEIIDPIDVRLQQNIDLKNKIDNLRNTYENTDYLLDKKNIEKELKN